MWMSSAAGACTRCRRDLDVEDHLGRDIDAGFGLDDLDQLLLVMTRWSLNCCWKAWSSANLVTLRSLSSLQRPLPPTTSL